MYALEVAHLNKAYKDFSLKDICLKLPKGSIMGLIGENGAGKSTTFKAILDLIQKDSGKVAFYGEALSDEAKELKEQIGVVFDGMNFYETLTPKQIGKIGASTYKNWDMAVYEDYMKRFKLDMTKEIKTFSKGMQVKLSLAFALSHHAKLLILDEATSGLDPVMRDDILDIFLEFVQDEEHAILISSHISSDLEKVADYITFIHEGRIVLSKMKDELIYDYGILRCKKDVFDKIAKEDREAYRKIAHQYEVLVKDKKKMAAKYKEAVVDSASLDEIMLIYVKGEM